MAKKTEPTYIPPFTVTDESGVTYDFTVADMENLQNDAGSLKGFYKNRILRVLLVFLLSSLGSSAGTFVAGANFVKIISEFFDKILAGITSLFK